MLFPRCICVLLLSIIAASSVIAAELSGKVVSIADGDTITLLVDRTQYKIRLAGIDAPERGQAYGSKSTQALGKALHGKTVTVKTDSTDRYGRHIGTIYADGQNINEWMVYHGWAWHYKKYSDDPVLDKLEKAARANKAGLWADPKAIAPWEHRALKKQSSAIQKGQASSLGYWLNTSSNSRHNSSCKYYKNTKRGRACAPNEGKACGVCGG